MLAAPFLVSEEKGKLVRRRRLCFRDGRGEGRGSRPCFLGRRVLGALEDSARAGLLLPSCVSKSTASFSGAKEGSKQNLQTCDTPVGRLGTLRKLGVGVILLEKGAMLKGRSSGP